MLDSSLLLSLLFAGILTGCLTGLTGSSGVTIVVPLLTIFLRFSIYEAIGTSLIVDVIASLVISLTYLRHGNLDRAGKWIAVGAVLGAQLGALVATSLPETGLATWFAVSTIGTGVYLWLQNGKENWFTQLLQILRPSKRRWVIFQSLVIGWVLGIFAGLTGAGGGMGIFVALIILLDMPVHKAIGTSTLVMAFTALSGATGYYFQGEVNVLRGVIIGIGSIIGGVMSAKVANSISERKLTRVTASLFIGLGIAMVVLQYTGQVISHSWLQ